MPVALPIPAFDVSGLAGGLAGLRVLDVSPVASLLVGPVQFDASIWLFLIPLLGVVALLMGARSLSGLGPVTKWVAMSVRLIVIAVLAAALAEPQWRRESKDVSVTVVVDASESVPQRMQDDVTTYLRESVENSKKVEDRLGVVAAAKNAFIQSLPSKLNTDPDRQNVGAIDGTNLAAALRLASSTAVTLATTVAGPASGGSQVRPKRKVSATWPVPTGVAVRSVTLAPSTAIASVSHSGVIWSTWSTGGSSRMVIRLPSECVRSRRSE